MRRFILACYIFLACVLTFLLAYTVGPLFVGWYALKWTARGAVLSGYAAFTRGFAKFLPSKDARQLLLHGILHPLKTATKELNNA